MTDTLKQFDHFLASEGPAALVIREHLMPVEGNDAVFFPATYAAKKQGEPGGYNIDYENPRDKTGKNIVLIDSVGSQANRIEPMFAEGGYAKLVPQITIKVGEKKVCLLDAGHRAGDALVRYSDFENDLLQQAFEEILKGNVLPLAKLAPTSLVFGVWDSRGTQTKLPRLISSTIRAFNVRELTRSAQFWAGGSSNPVTIFDDEAILGPIKDEKDKDERSSKGVTHVPSTGAHGGVIAEGGIRRDAVLALSALKLLKTDNDEDTQKLQRYILGLALVAFTKLPLGYFRQGSILVLDPEKSRQFDEVALNGNRTPLTITHEEAVIFAQAAAKDFGVGEDKLVNFNPQKYKNDNPKKSGGGKGKKEKEKDNAEASAKQPTINKTATGEVEQ